MFHYVNIKISIKIFKYNNFNGVSVNFFNRTALHAAVERENIEVIKFLLQQNTININIKDNILILKLIKLYYIINDFIFNSFWGYPIDYTENDAIKKLFIR